MKRLFDLTAVLVALLLCLPLAVLTLLVAAKLGRPAFFRRVRPSPALHSCHKLARSS